MASNNTIELKDLMGDPLEMLQPILPEIKWLFGTITGFAFLVVMLCIILIIIKASLGTVTGDAAMRAQSQSAAVGIIGILFVSIVAAAIAVFIFNKFLLP